jgi:predicted nucleic acid-binding protein
VLSSVFIADSSAWNRVNHPAVAGEWSSALRDGRVLICWPVRFELLFSATNAADFRAVERRLSALRDVPVTASVQRAALGALRELAERAPGYHRVPLPDLLVAAAAQEAGVGVLHYDRHFDRLAEVLSFDSHWLAPRGTW